MIQGAVQCLPCKKFEVHSNALTTVPCPTNKHTREPQVSNRLRKFGKWQVTVPSPPPPPEGTLSCCTCAQEAVSLSPPPRLLDKSVYWIRVHKIVPGSVTGPVSGEGREDLALPTPAAPGWREEAKPQM